MDYVDKPEDPEPDTGRKLKQAPFPHPSLQVSPGSTHTHQANKSSFLPGGHHPFKLKEELKIDQTFQTLAAPNQLSMKDIEASEVQKTEANWHEGMKAPL